MNLGSILAPVAGALRKTLVGLENRQPLPALGLRRAARLPVLAALRAETRRPILLLTDRADRALAQSEELGLWAPEMPCRIFPEPTALFYENAPWSETTRRDRLNALTALAAYHIPGAPTLSAPPVIIAPIRALMARTLPRRDFLKVTRILRCGQSTSPDALAHHWVLLGYEAVNTVVIPGQFARRGGLLDIWPPAEPQPLRLEFFGDEIETMRCFDPASQRTLKTPGGDLQRLLIPPAREFLLSSEAAETLGEINEFHLPLLHASPASLIDYLPRQALVLLDDPQALQDVANEVEEQSLALRRDGLQEGTIRADYPIPYLTWAELHDALSLRQVLTLGSDPGQETFPMGEPGLAELFSAGPRFGGRLKPAIDHLQERCTAGETMLVVSRQSPRLIELWQEQAGPQAEPSQPPPCQPVFIEGSLAEGWTFFPEQGRAIHLLTDGELFGWRRPEPRQRHRPMAEAPEAPYADLRPGDWVVHIDHGIGRLVGLVSRTVEGAEREYLCIEYAEAAQLFVPVHQVDRLTRYIGPEGRPPTPSRLGGSEWRTARAEAKQAVEGVAEDLLELYAKRSVVSGYTFEVDTAWQQELEASFPYIETDDQMRVLAEVKRDMESDRPMDRLICGDVGYGKTEVALRAAFKAVASGKQVAVLVPTTVLAQQHYHTFQQRLAAFPVTVEMLSRFRTPQQQNEIIQRLDQGGVDILIGTHRLFSSDVHFKDLGLLIIDEEQRFGVTHKEALKKMRTEVDVLTLTATPIPRTLYMALSGVRDISTINTPPEERLPIITHVGPYSPRLVRQAVLRELERGGQVFFVHNRVQTIEAMRKHLEHLTPEARIAVAHGQMHESELSQRMEQFTAGEVDILLTTSIIESGLDIPSANTLIVDRADTFGLAQLYQLRGRVGRGAQRAYAYFFRHNRKAPTPEGQQRLETISENTQLGAGFSIAMRDLEIRGAGDLLGMRQHGHIAAVGFHLYTRMLAEAVRRLRQDRSLNQDSLPPLHPAALAALTGQANPVNVELPLAIHIPVEYVADKSIRLGLYRRMADLRSLSEIQALAEEFSDRFGPPPETVQNLFLQLTLKLLAAQAGLSSVTVESGQIVLRYPDHQVPADLLDPGAGVRVGKTALWMPYHDLPDWKEHLVQVLTRLKREAASP